MVSLAFLEGIMSGIDLVLITLIGIIASHQSNAQALTQRGKFVLIGYFNLCSSLNQN